MKSHAEFDCAWRYARWKYGISVSGATSIQYSSSLSSLGNTSVSNDVSLGGGAFENEWTCASVLGHEIVHCNQSYVYWVLYPRRSEMEAYDWELAHNDAPSTILCNYTPITYIYSQSYSTYDDAKAQYSNYGGTLPYP